MQANIISSTSYEVTNFFKEKDRMVRKSYNTQVSETYEKFKPKFAEFHDKKQCFGENLAREAYNARNTIKEAHQKETSWLGWAGIKAHNLMNYASLNGPEYDYFVKKGKNPEEIAYSAFKTGGADLGLENNGFGKIIDIWFKTKNANPELYPELYPEQFTAEIAEEISHDLQNNFTSQAIAEKLKTYSSNYKNFSKF